MSAALPPPTSATAQRNSIADLLCPGRTAERRRGTGYVARDIMGSPMPHKIDIHSHYLPPSYQQFCRDNGHGNPDGMPYLPDWSPEAHLDLMNKNGISKSILSISSPGTHLVAGDDALAAKIARDANSYAADLKKKMPDRFGYFASLPIPDVETCLKEINLSSAEGCDGFVLMTNGHGHYLGDKSLDAIFDELNRRQATVFVHPTTPRCPCTPQGLAQGHKPMDATPFAGRYPNPMLEFMYETSRIVTHLFMSGTMTRCPNIQVILPHLGGAMPPLLSRWTGFSTLVPGDWEAQPEVHVREALNKQFWFDLAGFVFPSQIKGLMQGVGISHERILYGSDFPFTRAEGVAMLLGQMDKGVKEMFSTEKIEDMYHKNAERLLSMPRQK